MMINDMVGCPGIGWKVGMLGWVWGQMDMTIYNRKDID